MKNQVLEKVKAYGVTAVMIGAFLVGCAGKESVTTTENDTSEPYFTKGVYVNYVADAEDPPLTYFYVFYDEASGYTEDGINGIGLPFACEQRDGTVVFHMGGAGEEEKELLTVDSFENGTVIGHMENGIKLAFVPEEGADPDNFNAQNYVNAETGEDAVFESANGWKVRYDPSVITVNDAGSVTTFVYTGESAGTNMVTATYDVGKDAKTVIEDLQKEWGDNAQVFESSFPGAEDVDGYWVTLTPTEDGSGLYETAIARDYMDGYLLFEMTGHNSGDDAIDIPVSDALATIIDSLEFIQY